METVLLNGREYIQTYEDGKRVLKKEYPNGFKVKATMVGTKETEDEFKKFVANLISKNY